MSKKKKQARPPIEDGANREARSRGFTAAYNGKPRSTNPEVGKPTEQAWFDGWDAVHPDISAMRIEPKVAKQSAPDSALTAI